MIAGSAGKLEPNVEIPSGTETTRDLVQRVFAAYEDLDGRYGGAGGLRGVIERCERVRAELDAVSEDELRHVTSGIRQLLETLIRMDYELRTIQQVKRALQGLESEPSPPDQQDP